MYEKIYMHSLYEQRKNKIFGLKEYVCVFVMGIPFIMLGIALFTFLNGPLKDEEYTIAFSVLIVIWIVAIGAMLMNCLKNTSKIFAIGKKGNVYIMNMSKEAASYLSLNTAMHNMGKSAVGNKPTLEMLKIVGKTAADTFMNMDDSDIEDKVENVGLCIDKVDKVVVKKRRIIIYGKWGKKKKLIIPRMYNEMDELVKYFEFLQSDRSGEFIFHKKTKEDFLNERIKKNPYKIFVTIFCVVMWLFIYNFSNDLNRYAHIKYDYVKVVASIEGKESEGKENFLKVTYKTEEGIVDAKVSIGDEKEKYKEGGNIELYYNKSDVAEIICSDSITFLIEPFLVLLLGFEVIAFIIKIFGKK